MAMGKNEWVVANSFFHFSFIFISLQGSLRWMIDDLWFYVLLNSISVISGRWEDDNERLCALEPHVWFEIFPPHAEL